MIHAILNAFGIASQTRLPVARAHPTAVCGYSCPPTTHYGPMFTAVDPTWQMCPICQVYLARVPILPAFFIYNDTWPVPTIADTTAIDAPAVARASGGQSRRAARRFNTARTWEAQQATYQAILVHLNARTNHCDIDPRIHAGVTAAGLLTRRGNAYKAASLRGARHALYVHGLVREIGSETYRRSPFSLWQATPVSERNQTLLHNLLEYSRHRYIQAMAADRDSAALMEQAQTLITHGVQPWVGLCPNGGG